MASLQEADYGTGRDYIYGSPHLKHASLRSRIERDLATLVREQIAERGRCRAVEIGGGHGTFTDVLANAGARVTVTEMSRPSADVLRRRFDGNDKVSVLYDPTGEARTAYEGECDLLLFISVIHHIPDYETAVRKLVERVSPGGAFYSTQDPIWYPNRSRLNLAVDRGSYLIWRLGQKHVRRGIATRWRRFRGVYDAANPSDMVEYHVVRQGVNQDLLASMLATEFANVRLNTYWSTQASLLQHLGEFLRLTSTFSLIARGRKAKGQ